MTGDLITVTKAVPSYVIGFVLIYVLSINLGLLPTGGWGEPKHLIMPVIAFSLGPMAIVARMTRINTPYSWSQSVVVNMDPANYRELTAVRAYNSC